ncbi:MAG: choice-of-anchor D domain-containing protein [Acidobacteriota bacterium]
MEPSRPKHTLLAALSRRLSVLVCGAILVFALPADAQNGAPQLIITTTSSLPGEATAVEVRLVNPEQQVAAITFSIEFDSSRLAFDGGGADGQLTAVETSLPKPLRASSFYFPDQSRVGISVYSANIPVTPIPEGLLARIHFTVKNDVSGFAFVRLDPSPAPDAASVLGESVALGVQSSQSGVSVASANPLLQLAPQQIVFGSVPVGGTLTRELIVSNTGSAPLDLQQIHLAGGTSPFAIVSTPALPDPLDGGSSMVLRLSFSPETVGDFQDVLIIDTNGEQARVPLAASAVPAEAVGSAGKLVVPMVFRAVSSPGDGSLSSLTLFNAGDEALSVRLALHQPGAIALLRRTIDVAPGHSEHFDDVVQSLFGDIEGSGAVVIEPSGPGLIARSTAWTLPASGGRMGQSIPVLRWSELLTTGQTGRLIGVGRSAADGSSVALMNLSEHQAVIHARVLRGDGSLAGERDYAVGAEEIMSRLDLFDALGIGEASNLVIEFSTATPDSVFVAWRTATDNRTGARLFDFVR